MRKLSTGQDSTLKSYIENAKATFGEESPAVAFLKEKAAGAPKGEDEEFIADEAQVLQLLANIR